MRSYRNTIEKRFTPRDMFGVSFWCSRRKPTHIRTCTHIGTFIEITADYWVTSVDQKKKKEFFGSVSDNSWLADRLNGELLSDGKGKKHQKVWSSHHNPIPFPYVSLHHQSGYIHITTILFKNKYLLLLLCLASTLPQRFRAPNNGGIWKHRWLRFGLKPPRLRCCRNGDVWKQQCRSVSVIG